MRSFLKAGLKEKNINDIVSYVRSFERAPLSSSAAVLKVEKAVISRESPYDLATTVEMSKKRSSTTTFPRPRAAARIRADYAGAGRSAPQRDVQENAQELCRYSREGQAMNFRACLTLILCLLFSAAGHLENGGSLKALILIQG